ncbi:MAG TPA: hypothetical protein VG866_01785 [Candidatus Paceibacterota bacterium]|nr:hypothetical protein [Candidatus Paceibacterota bacterium]
MTKSAAYRLCLETIDSFAVAVAQKIVGGTPLHHSHFNGDLDNDGVYFEVKASGLSSGPIIEETQLLRYFEQTDHECYYLFICYVNRGAWRGKRRNLPLRIIRSAGESGLKKFLAENIRAVYLIPISVIQAIYEKERMVGRVKTHAMKTGPKTYFRLRYPDLRLILAPGGLEKFGLTMSDFVFDTRSVTKRIERFKIRFEFYRITSRAVAEDSSFDIAEFERGAAGAA